MKNFVKNIFRFFGFDLRIYRPSTSDASQLSFFLTFFKVSVVLDIGANEGQYASQLRMANYKSKIISFEPLTSAHKKLKMAAAHDKNWVIYDRVAIGSTNETVDINISMNSQSSSLLNILESHTNAEPQSGYFAKEKVNVLTIDSIYEGMVSKGDVVLLKSDTQGFDYNVLLGAQNSLKKITLLQIEVSFEELYAEQKLFSNIYDFLILIGFELYSIHREFTDTNTAKTLQYNAFFVRTIIA